MLELRDRAATEPAGEIPDLRARAARDRMLFRRLKGGDRRARAELIERFLPLARSLSRRYERRGESLEDLVQVASMALVKAVDRFDSDRGVAFSSYAVPTITGELKRHFRDRGWAVRPPRAIQELSMRLNALEPRLSRQLDRALTVGELAAAGGVSDEQVLEALQARCARYGLSLQAPAGAEDNQELQDTIAVSDDGFSEAEDRAVLDGLLKYLSPRSAMIMRLRFEQDLTQAEIGAMLDVSQMQISRIMRAAITQLREVTEQQERMLERRSSGARRRDSGAFVPDVAAPATADVAVKTRPEHGLTRRDALAGPGAP